MSRPATRVGNVAILEGGKVKPLTPEEQEKLDRGEVVLIDPRDGFSPRLLGEDDFEYGRRLSK